MPVLNLTSRQLAAVVAVEERQNISHAAIELSMSQPALSRLISRIESELETQLFDRDGRGVSPTEAGRRLAEHAREVLRQLGDMEDDIRSLDGELRGRICVAMPETIGHALFLPLIDRCAEIHPAVELRVMGTHPNNVPSALGAGDGDVGVVSSAHKQGSLHVRPFAVECLHLVGPQNSPFTGDTRLADVAALPLALPGIQPGLRREIDAAFASQGLKPNVVMELDSQDALIELIRYRELHSIMSFAGVMRYVHRGELTASRIVDPTIDRTLSTALPDNRPASALMRALDNEIHSLAADLAPETRWHPHD
ncbi:MAG: LysR family transcriptional regulator [Acidimicrobiales bacterium]